MEDHQNDEDLFTMERGLYRRRRRYSDMGDNHHRIQEKARKMAKSLDPRLIMVVEFFRELYVRRKELFQKTFPGEHHQFGVVLDEITKELIRSRVGTGQGKVRGLRRSLSIGSSRELKGIGGEPSLRLERFKIRTVNVGDDKGGGNGGAAGQDETKSTGSK